MCFLSLGGGCCLKFLSSSLGEGVCFPIQCLYADGSGPANKVVWDGGKREEC